MQNFTFDQSIIGKVQSSITVYQLLITSQLAGYTLNPWVIQPSPVNSLILILDPDSVYFGRIYKT